MRYAALFIFFIIGLLHSQPVGNDSVVDTHIESISLLDLFEQTGYSQDRCCKPGCIAQVRPGDPENVARIVRRSQATAVYFAENSKVITTEGKREIRDFVEANPNVKDITIIGYTDGCGSSSYNHTLSMERASVVSLEYQRLTDGVRIRTYPAGEISAGHVDVARRVDITATSNVTVYDPPPRIVADVYLVDGSASMSGRNWELWRRAIAFHRPPRSRVFISTTACIANGRSYSSVGPAGGTEIWYSYWSVLDRMQPGQTLLIISDFDSNYPLTGAERNRLISKVEARGVTVRAISLSR